MPLTLVTGPANAAKAGEVLGGLRARLEEEPILVVPAFQDVEHNQRELAERGAVFGARVLRFDWLLRLVAERAGYGERVATDLQRELIVERAIVSAPLRVLAESARHEGFARAALKFIKELEGARVEPDRFATALRRWARAGGSRAYADEVAAIYRGYRERLAAAGLADAELFGWRALDALRRDPDSWGRTPVFVYGFDDFDPLQLDALETLAKHCGVAVTVSLPFEPGRIAFKAVAEVHAQLAALADDHVRLEAISDHYADESREALHHLERFLFQDDPPVPPSAGVAVARHAAGGMRAEVELVGAEVLGLLRAGTAAGEVAIVFRDPQSYASVVEQVFEAYGIPFSISRRVRLDHTGLGRGLLALLRCATRTDAPAEDLLAYLRTPGKLRIPRLADRVEAEVRRQGARTAAAARAVWEELNPTFELSEIDQLREARDTRTLLERLAAELQRLFAGPHLRKAPVLAGSELEDPRAFRVAHDALRQLHVLAGSLDGRRIHDTLAELTVRVGETPQPDRVQVASPEAIRARRFEAVFICGLQEGEFPRGASPEPFLSDDDRRGLASEGDLVLRVREDQLDRERYLFYVCASRAERLLVLSSRYCDEEGDPESPSFFLDDATSLLAGIETRRRRLSDVAWKPEEAPTADEWGRAVALRGPRRADPQPGSLTEAAVLEWLAERDAVSAGALERYADCPVKWLVEDILKPAALEPDPEAMVRGRFTHEVLQRTFARLRDEVGSRRVTEANLNDAERILLEELQHLGPEFTLSPDATRVRAALRRLEFDLVRYLRHEAGRDGDFEPAELEYSFETEIDGVTVRGRIDRVDTWNGHALVRDYKSGKTAASYRVEAWEDENRLQAPLYMLAAERLLGAEPAGGVYVPLAGEERRPRGAVAADIPQVGSDFFDGDRVSREQLQAALDRARERLTETAAAMARGELRCTPHSCSFRGGCSYPSICRVEE